MFGTAGPSPPRTVNCTCIYVDRLGDNDVRFNTVEKTDYVQVMHKSIHIVEGDNSHRQSATRTTPVRDRLHRPGLEIAALSLKGNVKLTPALKSRSLFSAYKIHQHVWKDNTPKVRIYVCVYVRAHVCVFVC